MVKPDPLIKSLSLIVNVAALSGSPNNKVKSLLGASLLSNSTFTNPVVLITILWLPEILGL